MQCFYYLGKLGSSLGLTSEPAPSASSTHIVPESPATSLARTLHAFSEHVAPVLHHRRRNVLHIIAKQCFTNVLLYFNQNFCIFSI